jgi:phage tail-like protein
MLLNESTGWQMAPTGENVIADHAVGGLRLGSLAHHPIPFIEQGGTFGGLTRPTGLAIGPDGHLFLADPGNCLILHYAPYMTCFEPLWTPEGDCPPAVEAVEPNAYQLNRPRGLAFSPQNDLAVADTGNARINLYTWPHLQPRQVIRLPGSEVWDLAYDARGWLYAADSLGGRIWRFDPLWRLDTAYHGGLGTLRRPRHLALDDGDRLFVVDQALERVVGLDALGRVIPGFVAERLVDRRFPLPLRLEDDTLYLAQDERPDCPALPLPGLQVDRSGRLVGRSPMLLARPNGIEYPRSGVYVTQALDSGMFNCPWHRVVFDADLPELTRLTVRTLTAANEMDPQRVAGFPLSRWSAPLTINAGQYPECLLQSPPGRYLWLRLEFGSNGQATPLVRAITLYAPRQSSLRYLPPVFQADPVSADFLDRFLSLFDTLFAEIETQVDEYSSYLDPDSVPTGPFLEWLGAWFDLKFLDNWPEETRRTLIRRAIALYKKRGTLEGLQEILRLHTGLQTPMPAIIEHFRMRNYAGRWERGVGDLPDGKLYLAGQPFQPGAGEIAHHFTVFLPSAVVPEEEAVGAIRSLIDSHAPAHTQFFLRLVRPGIRIGCQSTIGIDTLIGSYPSEPLGKDMILLVNGRLGSPDEGRLMTGRTRMIE